MVPVGAAFQDLPLRVVAPGFGPFRWGVRG